MSSATICEFAHDWLPHATDSGIRRLIQLLEQGSALLVHGSFTKSCAQGCLATHIAWHHPLTSHWDDDAGVRWLTHVAKLNPATSRVILAWDRDGSADWELRQQLASACRAELEMREPVEEEFEESAELCWS